MANDFDYDNPANYKGFDLSEVDEKDLADMMERVDLIHENLNTIKELCKKLISNYEPVQNDVEKLKRTEPDIHQKIMEEAMKLYGEERGKRFVEVILGKPDQESIKLQIAKAKAFIVSYERQFDDESIDPIAPAQFEDSDVFKIMQKLTGGRKLIPNLTSSSG